MMTNKTECNCSLSIKLCGDGCKKCQPDTYILNLESALQSADEENEQLKSDIELLKKAQVFDRANHKIVPIEPTEEWINNLIKKNGEPSTYLPVEVVRELICELLAAAPEYQECSQWISVDDRLQSQAQQTESQWISVDERLPENNSHVLVTCEGGNVATTFYTIDHSFFDNAHGHKLSRKVHGKHSKHFELARQYGYKITHWMPLPPAPNGDKP